MKTIRRILVAIKDPQARSSPAVDKAIQLAKSMRASLELYHALASPVYMDFEVTERSLGELQDERLNSARQRLEVLAARAREEQLKVSVSVTWDFPPHEAVIRQASKSRADLIVAECHEGRRLTPWLVHLTDWELIRTSSVPVLLVRNKQLYDRPIVLAALDPTHSHAKPAKLDEEILSAGQRFSQALRGSLHAMHAYFPVPLDVPSSAIRTDASAAILYTRVKARAREAFERVTRPAHISRARRHLVDVHPVDSIPATAREIGADLVIMGAVSRSGLKRVFIGNTAERALGTIHCDVLVVKPPRFTSSVARDSNGLRLVPPQIPLAY